MLSPHNNLLFSLDQNQKKKFKDNGFLILENFLSKEELLDINLIYNETFFANEQESKFLSNAKIKEVALSKAQVFDDHYADKIFYTLENRIRHVFQQVFGAKSVVTGCQAQLKRPNSGIPTPWHQDEAYWDEDEVYEGGVVWIALDDILEKNGCLQYIPGSHKSKVFNHKSLSIDSDLDGFTLNEDQLNYDNYVSCPVVAGTAIVHHCRIIHRTGENISKKSRRTYISPGGLPRRKRQKNELKRSFHWQKDSTLIVEMAKLTQWGEFPRIAGWWEPKNMNLEMRGNSITCYRPNDNHDKLNEFEEREENGPVMCAWMQWGNNHRPTK